MFQVKDMPLLPGQNDGRPMSEPLSVDELKGVGIQGGAFALHVNDVIEFENTDKPLVVSQPVRKTPDSPKAYYVGCTRNGQASWLGIGILTRRDVDGHAIGEFQSKALAQPSFKEVYANLLAGKKITAKETASYKAAKFDDAGNRIEGETIDRSAPVIVYAE